jgi:hypothetical protein
LGMLFSAGLLVWGENIAGFELFALGSNPLYKTYLLLITYYLLVIF